MTDDNITKFPIRKKPIPDGERTIFKPVELARSSKCMHVSFVVDEKLEQVECVDCGERLNPIWVLGYLASEDRRMAASRKKAQEIIAEMEKRVRTKCQHCGNMTRINSK